MSRPFILGLTGSIGMGKSTAAGIFRDFGVPVWDADAAVHRLYDRGGAAVPAIAALCPEAIVAGRVDRAVLKNWIAHDPAALRQIEQAVHPLVAADRQDFLAAHAADALVVLDIPLLFETGADGAMDAVLVMTAQPETQRRRVMARPGMTHAQFAHMLSKQMPDAEKRARADYIIETRSLDQTRAEVQALLRKLEGHHA